VTLKELQAQTDNRIKLREMLPNRFYNFLSDKIWFFDGTYLHQIGTKYQVLARDCFQDGITIPVDIASAMEIVADKIKKGYI
jgi:hypothetical protein